jgi:hypothetical protein
MDLTLESLAEMRKRITRELSESTGKTRVREKKKDQPPVSDDRQLSIFDIISYPHEQQSFQFEGRAKDLIMSRLL